MYAGPAGFAHPPQLPSVAVLPSPPHPPPPPSCTCTRFVNGADPNSLDGICQKLWSGDCFPSHNGCNSDMILCFNFDMPIASRAKHMSNSALSQALAVDPELAVGAVSPPPPPTWPLPLGNWVSTVPCWCQMSLAISPAPYSLTPS